MVLYGSNHVALRCLQVFQTFDNEYLKYFEVGLTRVIGRCYGDQEILSHNIIQTVLDILTQQNMTLVQKSILMIGMKLGVMDIN